METRIRLDEELTRLHEMILRMAAIATAIDMIHESTGAFVDGDGEHAHSVAERLASMDAEQRALYAELVTIMKATRDPVACGIDLLALNGYLEKVGAHVVTICEWAVSGTSPG